MRLCAVSRQLRQSSRTDLLMKMNKLRLQEVPASQANRLGTQPSLTPMATLMSVCETAQ
jgi:hypothetical protein